MRTDKNELRDLVASWVDALDGPAQAVSSKELTIRLDKSHSHICQILRTLAVQGRITYINGKRSLDRSVRLYYSASCSTEEEESFCNRPTCGSCQWLSEIQRCILLDLVFESNPSVLPPELKLRAYVQEIPLNAPCCDHFDKRVAGQVKSRHMSRFIRENTVGSLFLCPIERCRQVIDEFSFYLQTINLGSSTFYCPHCGSPMVFGYDERFDDYRVFYWDSHFDILQQSFFELTGTTLTREKKQKDEVKVGISIIKLNSFTPDTKLENLFIGSKTSPEELVFSEDLTFFPFRKIGYIYSKHWEDYFTLKDSLHPINPVKGRKLYQNIELFPPIDPIKSVEPIAREVGGNELLIASGFLTFPSFQANLTTRVALIESKIREFVDLDLKGFFTKSLQQMKDTIRSYQHLRVLDHLQWQRYEGGVSSLMIEALKREAQKYGFLTPARSKSRMVRYDRFLPFGLYYARSAYDSLINGVNHVITTILKKDIYNEISLAWDGLRGWCHRKYPIGLYLDTIEQAKIIAWLWIHEAIRDREIQPSDFQIKRGKRYEPYYCVIPNSNLHTLIRKIGLQALKTTIRLATGESMNLKRTYEKYLKQQKELINKFAIHSSELLCTNLSENKQITLWKKLEQTKNRELLTYKELQQLHSFSQEFFTNEFSFEPLAIVEVC